LSVEFKPPNLNSSPEKRERKREEEKKKKGHGVFPSTQRLGPMA